MNINSFTRRDRWGTPATRYLSPAADYSEQCRVTANDENSWAQCLPVGARLHAFTHASRWAARSDARERADMHESYSSDSCGSWRATIPIFTM
jgi:hypothetical protein